MSAVTESFTIGSYQLGWRNLDLIADPKECGGSFFFVPDKAALSRIRVGFDYPEIGQAWAVLYHEALELLMADAGLRYRQSGSYVPNASDAYLFHFDHNQFSEIAAKLAYFSLDAFPDFKAAWDLVHPAP